MGANGAGKSTLVKILTGAVQPDGGTITVRGRPYAAHSPAEARRGGHRLASTRSRRSSRTSTSASNLRLTATPVEPVPALARGAGPAGPRSGELVRDLPLPSLRIIDLARALAIEPDVLLLDEMTAALPADLTERVLEVVGRQRGTGPLA